MASEFYRAQAAGTDVYRGQRKSRGIPTDRLLYLSPLLIAPVFPLIRIGLRKNPVLRDRVFFGAIAGAAVHGVALMTGWYKKVLDGDKY